MQNSMDRDQDDHAMCASFILSYLLEDNASAWTDAIQISLRLAMESDETSIMVSTLSCAIQRCGYEAYSQFRGILVDQGCPVEIVHMFDQMAKTLHDERASSEPKPPIMRLIEPASFDRALPNP